ncbi:site-specific integrase [Methylosinus sp. C49]|uniref:tyrosine-type recombinase/integrase n=1 Tax=Methylosinus sp. C49 TaxID=2699395 RepID=UPI00137A43DC|nr:site-specific integrase [Methylosinus sp. C49]
MSKRNKCGLYRRKNSKVYHFDFRLNGMRFYGSTGCTDKREAETFVQRVEVEAYRRPPPQSDATVKGDRTLSQAISDYIDQHLKHLSGSRKRIGDLQNIETKLGGDIMLSQINRTVMIQLRDKRLNDFRWDMPTQGVVSRGTVNEMLRALDGMLNYACETWDVPKRYSKLGKVLLKIPKPKTRVYTLEEQDRICKHLCTEDQAIVHALIRTALRRQNLVELKWEDVNLETGVLYLRVKGGDPEVIPMTPDIRAIIEERRGNHPVYVFTYLVPERRHFAKLGWMEAGSRFPVKGDVFYRHFRNACRKEGISGRVHDCRHTGATRTLIATHDLRAVQKLLKHKNIKDTERYTHLEAKDELAAMLAVEKMEKKIRARRQGARAG